MRLLGPRGARAPLCGHAAPRAAGTQAFGRFARGEVVLELLRAPHVEAKRHHYGYGVHNGEFEGEPAFWHHGDLPGYRSLSVWLPRRWSAIVVLSNEETTDTKAVARHLMAH